MSKKNMALCLSPLLYPLFSFPPFETLFSALSPLNFHYMNFKFRLCVWVKTLVSDIFLQV